MASPVADAGDRTGRFRLWPRFGLRARVILAFSIGALFLALVLSGLVLGITRASLVSQRESSATRIVANNASIIRSRLGPGSDAVATLSSLQSPEGSKPVLFERAKVVSDEPSSGWTATDPEYGRSAIPEDLRTYVLGGAPGKMRFVHPNGQASLAIGTPIADIDGVYFEIVSLESLDDTLTSISFILFGASIITVLAGAGFGWYSSRRILRPLNEVGSAASALAGGALDTRIRAQVDPDLAPIIESFNGMAGALEDRIHKDAQFASDVSHELRSPLMTLQASIEVLDNNREQMNERSQAALDLLTGDLDRFRELVEDLLEISRFDAGVMQLSLDEVLLFQFVGHAVRSVGAMVPVEFAPDAPIDPEFGDILAVVDKRRIARVISNLLGNADKYADGAVRIVLDADDEHVRIMVDDAGDGVPEEDRARIFERFNRAGAANRRGTGTGVGLGLALVAEHVRLHGGQVSVTDAPGTGARFVVELPVVTLDDDVEEILP